MLFAVQSPEFDGRSSHGSIVHADLHPDKHAALRCPPSLILPLPSSLTFGSQRFKEAAVPPAPQTLNPKP
jgi:hypothetical protein